MHSVHSGPIAGLVAQFVVLLALALTVGLSAPSWGIGVACGVFTAVALTRGLSRTGARGLGPADWVTLARASLIGGVASLVLELFVGSSSSSSSSSSTTQAIVVVSVVALLLDGVDGWVARRTGTASELGARFDAESDSFLILVLSIAAAPLVGLWVVVLGGARYLFLAAGWILPWMNRRLPVRYWRKVVAAVQGIALTVIVSGVLPTPVAEVVALVAGGLLAESFGRDVLWLWVRRHDHVAVPSAAGVTPGVSRAARGARA